jgi:hypothetical protein
MNIEYETEGVEFIELVRGFEGCDWCGRDGKKNRRGLCRSFDRVRKQLETIEIYIQEHPADGTNVVLDRELRVAKQVKKDCIMSGRIGKDILAGPVDPLGLEHWFRRIAERIAKDEGIHYGMANTLAGIFSPTQRQVVAYLFWEVFAAEESRQRKNRASGRVIMARGEEKSIAAK